MYLDYYKLNNYPFSLVPNIASFCELPQYQEALDLVLGCVETGEGIIKIVGEIGTGKTMLCRAVADRLADSHTVILIENTDSNPYEFRRLVAKGLHIDFNKNYSIVEFDETIKEALEDCANTDKPAIILIDEAQLLTKSCFEAIRLLTNLDNQEQGLLQVILFGQPELNEKINRPELRHFKQRIVFSYDLPTLNKDQVENYLNHRLAIQGYTQAKLFSKRAINQLYRASEGIPRVINILAHKALLFAYGHDMHEVTKQAITAAINDTESLASTGSRIKGLLTIIAGLALLSASGIATYFMLKKFGIMFKG